MFYHNIIMKLEVKKKKRLEFYLEHDTTANSMIKTYAKWNSGITVLEVASNSSCLERDEK